MAFQSVSWRHSGGAWQLFWLRGRVHGVVAARGRGVELRQMGFMLDDLAFGQSRRPAVSADDCADRGGAL